VGAASFTVWIIPHTLAMTNLARRNPQAIREPRIRLLANYVERLLTVRAEFHAASASGSGRSAAARIESRRAAPRRAIRSERAADALFRDGVDGRRSG